MMTVSSVSRKTTRKTGTEKTSLAIAGNEQRESAGKTSVASIGSEGRDEEERTRLKECKGES